MLLTRFLCACGLMLTLTHDARGQDSESIGSSREPLTLSRVIRLVTQRHPLVLAAEARITAARGARLTAGSWANPILTYEVENAPWPGSDAPANDRELMTSAMIPLEPLYQRWPRVARADAEVRAAEAAQLTVQRNVQLEAARAFYRVALAQVGFEAAAEVQTWLDSLVTYTRTRVNEGVAAEFDLLRLQVERDRARAETALRRVEVIRARAGLQSHLGASSNALDVATTDKNDIAIVAFSDTSFTAEPAPLPTLLTLALERRPELAETRERIAASGAMRTHERTLIVRELSAMLGTKTMGGQRSLMAGISAPLPLFDQNRGEIRRASAERVAAEYEHNWAERTIAAEVNAAYEAVRTLSTQAASLQGALTDRAEETRRITLGAYAEGATTLLQVLDVARATAEARVSFYQLLFAQHEAVLELNSAVGSPLMQDVDPRTPLSVPTPRRGAP